MAVCCSVIAKSSVPDVLNLYTSGRPWAEQPLNTSQTADLAWGTSSITGLPVGLYGYSIVATKGYVHALGGFNGSAKSDIYSAPINPDGTLGDFTVTGTLPIATYSSWANACVTGGVSGGVNQGYVWLFIPPNGVQSGANGLRSLHCPINENGTLGSWVNDGIVWSATFPISPSVTCVKDKIYVSGINGPSPNYPTLTKYYPINSDGTMGTPVTCSQVNTGSLASGVSLFTTNSRLYLSITSSNSTAFSTYYDTYDASGILSGTWTLLQSNLSHCGAGTLSTAGRAWFPQSLGTGATAQAMFSATINGSGVSATFSAANALPAPGATSQRGWQPVITSSKVYAFGSAGVIFVADFAGGSNYYGI